MSHGKKKKTKKKKRRSGLDNDCDYDPNQEKTKGKKNATKKAQRNNVHAFVFVFSDRNLSSFLKTCILIMFYTCILVQAITLESK